jgi:hypothetical protein
VGTGFLSWGRAAWTLRLTTHLYLGLRLRRSGALPLPLPCAFVTWRGTTLYFYFFGVKVPDKLFLEFEWVVFKQHLVYETVVF